MAAEEAVQYIQKRRRCANPNPGFMKQLLQFEKDLAKQSVPNSFEAKWEMHQDLHTEALGSIEKIKQSLESQQCCSK